MQSPGKEGKRNARVERVGGGRSEWRGGNRRQAIEQGKEERIKPRRIRKEADERKREER